METNPYSYRTPGTRAGFFCAPASVHIHISAGNSEEVMVIYENVRSYVESRNLTFKLTSIVDSVEGPQRELEDFRNTYGARIPIENNGHPGPFATIGFGPMNEVSEQLYDVVDYLRNTLNSVPKFLIEVERINGVLENGIWRGWPNRAPYEIPTLTDTRKIGASRAATKPIKIHHAVDFERSDESLSSYFENLNKVGEEIENAGVLLGGLFLFKKPDTGALRTLQFANYDDYREEALADHQRLFNFLKQRDSAEVLKVRTVVEQVLGMWCQPPISKRVIRALTVPELAFWERECQSGDEFWVVTSDFLGDIDPDIKEAMQNNLREGVHYVYFLHSYADVQRFRELVNQLRQDSEIGQLADRVKVVLINHDPLRQSEFSKKLSQDYFVRFIRPDNPENPKQVDEVQAYQLNRFSFSGNVKSGRRLREPEIKDLLDLLEPLMIERPLGSLVPQIPTTYGEGAVMFTDLQESTQWQQSLLEGTGEPSRLKLLQEYDLLVAREVSRAKGEVLKSMGDGYMCLFRTPRDEPKVCAARALRCATRIQTRLDARNRENPGNLIPLQRVALAFGRLRVVERGHGYDVDDDQIAKCSRLLNLCDGGHILATDRIWKEGKSQLSWKEAEVIHNHGSISLKGYKEKVACIEILWHTSDGHMMPPMESLDGNVTIIRD